MDDLRRLLAAAAIIGLSMTGCQQTKVDEKSDSARSAPAGDVQSQAIHSRAVQAAIWGMPLVNLDLMRQEMLNKTSGKVNQAIYWGRPLDYHNQTLTPNPDALYFMVFFDTKDGPMVIELPPGDEKGSFNGNFVTVWQMPLEDAGLYGYDHGKGGKYVVLPPGYKGKLPSGYIPLQSDTNGGYLLFRANLASHSDADVARSVAYGKQMKVYPLSQAAHPAETIFTDAQNVDYDSRIKYDWSLFEHLDRVIQQEPWLDRDKSMIDPLRSIGIEKGKPFSPSEDLKGQLTSAAQDGKEIRRRPSTLFLPAEQVDLSCDAGCDQGAAEQLYAAGCVPGGRSRHGVQLRLRRYQAAGVRAVLHDLDSG